MAVFSLFLFSCVLGVQWQDIIAKRSTGIDFDMKAYSIVPLLALLRFLVHRGFNRTLPASLDLVPTSRCVHTLHCLA